MTSPHLTRISIRLLPRADLRAAEDIFKDLESVDCAPLDALLASPRFSSLDAVVFDFGRPVNSADVFPVLVRRMPLLHNRGSLAVKHEIS